MSPWRGRSIYGLEDSLPMRWKVEVARWFAGMLLSGVLLAGCGVGSNDGKIVFTSSRDGDFEIFVMDADGTGLQQLTYQ